MRHCSLVATLAGACALISSPAPAQPIIVTPGLIQAPYFRMEWRPGGGAHIQAPFVDLYTGPICHPICATSVPAVSAVSNRPTTDDSLAAQLFAAGRKLNRSLGNFSTGARWQSYLGLTLGGPLSQIPMDRQPGVYLYPVSSNFDLPTLLDRFDAVSRDKRFRAITSLPEFEQTHQLLAAYLAARQNRPPASAEEIQPPAPAPEATPADDRPQPMDL